jgi:hypothetical protein
MKRTRKKQNKIKTDKSIMKNPHATRKESNLLDWLGSNTEFNIKV